jgi:hypothetical protein
MIEQHTKTETKHEYTDQDVSAVKGLLKCEGFGRNAGRSGYNELRGKYERAKGNTEGFDDYLDRAVGNTLERFGYLVLTTENDSVQVAELIVEGEIARSGTMKKSVEATPPR